MQNVGKESTSMNNIAEDTGVAQNSTPMQADNGVTAKINEPVTLDGKARVEAYLKRICDRVGITVEEFWLLDEVQLAVAVVVSKEDHHTWPFTTHALANCVNQERGKTQKQPITTSVIEALMNKLFSQNEGDSVLIEYLEVTKVLRAERGCDRFDIVIPRYQVKKLEGNHSSFLRNLEALVKGERASGDRELSWEVLNDCLCCTKYPSLEEVMRSASKTQFVEDPEFAAMDTAARIRTYWADFHESNRCRVGPEDGGITDEESGLFFELLMSGGGYGVSGISGFASTVDLAAWVNARRAKYSPPMAWNPTMVVTPMEIGSLLERLHFQKSGVENEEEFTAVDDVGITRKLVQQTDAHGQPALVPHYGFTRWVDHPDTIDEMMGYETELINRLIELRVIVRVAPGRWFNKYTGEEAI